MIAERSQEAISRPRQHLSLILLRFVRNDLPQTTFHANSLSNRIGCSSKIGTDPVPKAALRSVALSIRSTSGPGCHGSGLCQIRAKSKQNCSLDASGSRVPCESPLIFIWSQTSESDKYFSEKWNVFVPNPICYFTESQGAFLQKEFSSFHSQFL